MALSEQHQGAINETKSSLERMQQFDVATLPRTKELGSNLSFDDAVQPAESLVDLYRQLPVAVLDALSLKLLQGIRGQADHDYATLKAILDFTTDVANPTSERDSRLSTVEGTYDPTFEKLFPVISYSAPKSTDFEKLEREARTIVQAVTDKAEELQHELEARKNDAEEVLATIRKVATEQGVSQQAIYFKQEADAHTTNAATWLRRTAWLTVALGVYAVLTLFLHKIPWLATESSYETVQLAVSKVLIFASISFFLVLAARNYVASCHNSVVNRHRQNALSTYETLVNAANHDANRDIVLTKASECIFSAQSTGFGKGDGSADGGSYSVVSVSPEAVKQGVTP